MKRTTRIFAVVLVALIFAVPRAGAEDLVKIGVIDMIAVGADYKAYQEVSKRLMEKRDDIQKVIQREEKRVMGLYEEYKNKMAIISDQERREQQSLIESEDEKLQKFVSDQNKLLKREKEELDARTKREILEIVEEISTEQGLSIILEKNLIVWSRPDMDITEMVVQRLNERYPVATETSGKGSSDHGEESSSGSGYQGE